MMSALSPPAASGLCVGAPRKTSSAMSVTPSSALLRRIYEAKILRRLFGDLATSEHLSSAPNNIQLRGNNDSDDASSPDLCACEKAALAARLLHQIEFNVLHPLDLPGASRPSSVDNKNNTQKEPLAAVWDMNEPLGASPRFPFCLKTIIKVLRERISHEGPSWAPGGPAGPLLCEACGKDVTSPLIHVLDASLSLSALCALSSFRFSWGGRHRLSALTAAARKRRKKVIKGEKKEAKLIKKYNESNYLSSGRRGKALGWQGNPTIDKVELTNCKKFAFCV